MSKIYECFLRIAKREEQKLALITSDVSLTYHELKDKVDSCAKVLQKYLSSNKFVKACLFLPSNHYRIIVLLALIRLKVTYIPLDTNFPLERIKSILEDSKADFFIYDAKSLLFTHELSNLTVLIDLNELISTNATSNSESFFSSKESNPLFSIMYTSGSTGKPKGVCIREESIINLIQNKETFSFLQSDIVLHHSSFAFDLSTFEIWGALLNGCSLIIIDNYILFNPENFKQLLINQQVTVMWLTSQLFNNLYDINPSLFKSLRVLLIGGEQLDSKRVLALCSFEERPKVIINGYGPTEATVFATYYLVSGNETKIIPIGKPLQGVECYIQNTNGEMITAPGIEGELLISGQGLSSGYYNSEELNSKAFCIISVNGLEKFCYRSSDIVEYDQDFNLVYKRRKDFTVKFNGLRIDLKEIDYLIETKLMALQSFTCLVERPDIAPQLVSFVKRNKQIDNTFLTQNKWLNLYDNLYDPNSIQEENIFVGWNSSIDGKPFPSSLMKKWIEDTINKIQLLQCNNILEIGCGRGIFTSRLINNSNHYTCLDISANVIKFLKVKYKELLDNKLEIFHGRFLEDYTVKKDVKFDTIILNSVIQYFHDINYFEDTLKKCLDLLEKGGSIFIGDIRNYFLQSNLSLKKFIELNKRKYIQIKDIEYLNKLDTELQIAPIYFLTSSIVNKYFDCCIFAKGFGQGDELSLYRYDVILTPKDSISFSNQEHSLLNFIKKQNLSVRYENNFLKKLSKNKKINTKEFSKKVNKFKINKTKYILLDPYTFDFIVPNNISNLSTFHFYCKSFRNQQRNDKLLEQSYSTCVLTNNDFLEYYLGVLRKYLPHNMLPTKIIFVEGFPITHSGKIDRSKLLDSASIEIKFEGTKTKRDKVKGFILDIISQHCQTTAKQVSQVNSFYSLGLTSLSQLNIAAQINKQYGINLNPFDPIFRASFSVFVTYVKQLINNNKVSLQVQQKLTYSLLPFHKNKINEQKNHTLACYNNVIVKVNYMFPWNEELWKKTLLKVYKAHTALQMNFSEKNISFLHDKPDIIISDSYDISIFEEMCTTLKNQIVDLKKDRLIRFFVFRVNEEENILLIYFHHLLIDLYSINYVIEHIHKTYMILYYNKPLCIKSTNYEKCLNEQRQFKSSKDYLNKLKKLVNAVSSIKTNRFPDDKTYEASNLRYNVPSNFIETLQHIAEEENVSFFVLTISKYLLAISQWLHLSSLAVLYVGSRRNTVEGLNTVGLLSDYMVLIKKDSLHTFHDLVQDISNQLHLNDVFYEDILKTLKNKNKSFNEKDVFNLLFDYQEESFIKETPYKYEIISQKVMKRYITFRFIKKKNEAEILVRYRSNVFKKADIETLLTLFLYPLKPNEQLIKNY